MRRFNIKQTNGGVSYDKVAAHLAKKMETHKELFGNPHTARVSFESLTEAEAVEHSAHQQELEGEMIEAVDGQETWEEELTDGQRDAALITMSAAGDPAAYNAVATDEVQDGDALLDANTVDVQNISQESYDARELEKLMPYSIAFNTGAARQDAAMEAVFPTIALTADQAGLALSVTRTMVHHNWTHTSQGASTKSLFNQKKLIDALIDSSILRNQATDIIPAYSATVGIFDTTVGPFNRVMDNATVQSGAILFGTPFNLISAGANGLNDVFGVKDMTDTVDQLVRLKTVYLEVTNDESTTSILPIDVLDLPYTSFQKSQEGNERQVTLQWNTITLPLEGKYKDTTGVDAPALAKLRTTPYDNHVFFLRISAHGTLNLADGEGELTAGTVSIDSVFESVTLPNGATDLVKVTDSAALTAARALFSGIKLRSFELDARYANLNRRERGLIVRQDVRTQKYAIQLQPPTTALKPVTDTASGVNLDGAVQATRVANTTAGIAELLHIDSMLSRYRASSNLNYDTPDIPGIGAWLIRPYRSYKQLDMTKLVNNVNSHTLHEDISSHLTLLLRDEFSKAMMISGYLAAKESAPGSNNDKVTAVIVSDPRVNQFLVVKGDTRLFGDTYNTMPVISNYLEFRDKIYMVPRRESSVQSPDGLNFGNMFWLPELITNMPIARGGQISNEFTVQTRRRHIVHCPIVIRVDLLNLNKVIDQKVPMAITQ